MSGGAGPAASTTDGGSPRDPIPTVSSQARKLEGELDAKLAAYGKLCTGYESSYATSKRGEAGLSNDQVGRVHRR